MVFSLDTQGKGGWVVPRHTDTAWVTVKLRDVNDNAPRFQQDHVFTTLMENDIPNGPLARLSATDFDMVSAMCNIVLQNAIVIVLSLVTVFSINSCSDIV